VESHRRERRVIKLRGINGDGKGRPDEDGLARVMAGGETKRTSSNKSR